MSAPGIDCITKYQVKALLEGYDTGTSQDSKLDMIIWAMTGAFEMYMNRPLQAVERTQYFDIRSKVNLEFFPTAVPISAVTVYYDHERDFDDAADSDSVVIAPDGMSFHLVDGYAVSPGIKVLKAVYTGGLATSTSNVTFTVASGGTGTYAVGEVVNVGADAKGAVVSWDATTLALVITPTNYDFRTAGIDIGDTITGASSSAAHVAESNSTSNLLKDYPELMFAATEQVHYTFKRKDHPSEDRVTVLTEEVSYVARARALCDEAKAILIRHRLRPLGIS